MAKKNLTLEEKLEEAIVKAGPYEVPGNWVWSKLQYIFDNVTSSNKKLKQSEYKEFSEEFSIPIIDQGENFVGGHSDKFELTYDGELPILVFGDHSRCIKYVDFNFIQGADGVKILLQRDMNTKYLYYMLKNLRLPDKGYSRHYKFLREELMPIAPLKEQQRIVDRIESLFEKLDKAKELIEEAREGFEKRKSAVLDKAFSGELTREWRKLNSNQHKPLSDEELEFLRNKYYDEFCSVSGKKSKLKESCKIDIKGKTKGIDKLYDLPKSWRWVSIGQITWGISDGPHFSPNYTPSGVPIISSRNVKYKKIDFSDAKYVSYEDYCEFIKRGRPEVGDILLTKGGTTGIVTMIDSDVEFCIWVHVALLKLVRNIAYPEYIRDVLHSNLLYNQSQAQTHGVANRDLGLTRMVYMALPLPPINEQKEIVRILGKLLEEESKIEELTQLEEQIELIKKSILAKAFRGELVTNSEEDESALELLKEILIKE
ncbi:MAG: restriction endonuclease subunit S [Clostridium sp.]|uniref:restriction endonuclease subunit S n=1 Tax=Clostridium sp. TaxID=1506 RepID=UPI0025BE1BE2|nr:restriction endonuclease subunit S [Clostridium sp.]MCE5221463.1 restriction endonuclease subunit S [Clostridium sp.]